MANQFRSPDGESPVFGGESVTDEKLLFDIRKRIISTNHERP